MGRTNANDCSMQDGVGIHRAAPRHAIHHPSRRLYLACSAYTFSLSSTPLRIYLPLSLFLPLFKIPRKFRRREKGIPFSLSLSRIFPPVNRAFRIPRSIRFLLLRSRFLEKTETNPGRKTVEGESIALPVENRNSTSRSSRTNRRREKPCGLEEKWEGSPLNVNNRGIPERERERGEAGRIL